MLKLIKYLKSYVGIILVVIVLLAIQAFSELSLPDYTSKIVNIGIQQGGIENAIPSALSEDTYEKLLLVIEKEKKDLFEKSYRVLDKSNFSEKEFDLLAEKYPSSNEMDIYILNELDPECIDELNSALKIPMTFIGSLSMSPDIENQLKNGILTMVADLSGLEKLPFFELLKALPSEAITSFMEEATSEFNEYPEQAIDQMAYASVKAEYEALGVDTDKLQSDFIFNIGGKMILVALIAFSAAIIVNVLAARIAAGLGRDLRSKVFSKVLSFNNSEMDKFSTASLITRSTNDIQQIQMLMVMLIKTIFYAPIMGTIGIVKAVNATTSLSWIIALAVFLVLSLVISLFIVVLPKFKSLQKLIDRLNLVSREILTGVPVIRAFTTQKHEEKRFDKANTDLTNVNIFVNKVMSGMMPAMMLLMNGVAILIVWFGAKGVQSGDMQVGDIMAFIQYTMNIIMSFLFISFVSIMLPRAAVSAARIDEVIETKSSINDPQSPKKFSDNSNGVVEFKNVSFKYPQSDENALHNINFKAEPGKTTAIIGSTGSGKSTLINLIPRFYDATEGEILIDGINVKDVSMHDVHEKIGYVPQKAILFSGDISSNIKFSNENLSDEQMLRAAKIAQAEDFIEAKDDKYKSHIAQGGTNVSGGQKQRLSIARAIVSSPDIYIFDDSFSALDFKTDLALRNALKEQTTNSTVIIVAQRISTIMHAEQILVLDEGEIVGMGTHKELLKNCDVYQNIALSQLSKEELENA